LRDCCLGSYLQKVPPKKERNKRWGGTIADTIPASRPTEIVFLSFDATNTQKIGTVYNIKRVGEYPGAEARKYVCKVIVLAGGEGGGGGISWTHPPPALKSMWGGGGAQITSCQAKLGF
jgi:hypothetical protein